MNRRLASTDVHDVPLHRTGPDLPCTPAARIAAVCWARSWCTERVLGAERAEVVARVVDEAVEHGFCLDPQGVELTIGWLDLDRFRVDLVWSGCAPPASAAAVGRVPDGAVDLFDAAAETWGLEAFGAEAHHWFTFDTEAVVALP